jgi:hypothetical protein
MEEERLKAKRTNPDRYSVNSTTGPSTIISREKAARNPLVWI